MTSRNLNKTWRSVLFSQYKADLEADVPFPVHYLIYAIQWKRDIFVVIPRKIDEPTFRSSVIKFFTEKHLAPEPDYEDEHIAVYPRKRLATTATGETIAEDTTALEGDTSEEALKE